MDNVKQSLLRLIADNDQDREEKLTYMKRTGGGSVLEIADWFERSRKSFLCWLVEQQSELNETVEDFIRLRELIREGCLTDEMRARHAMEFFDAVTRSIGVTYLIDALCQAELKAFNDNEDDENETPERINENED